MRSRFLLVFCVYFSVLMMNFSPVMAECGPSKVLFQGAFLDETLEATGGNSTDLFQNTGSEQKAPEVVQQPDDWVLIGEEAIRSGEYVGALRSFDKALSLDEMDERAWNGKITAQLNLETERFDSAVQAALDAVEKVPASSNLHANLARVYLYKTDYRLAADAAKKAVDLDQENMNAQLMMAWAQLYTGAVDDALQTAELIRDEEPTNPDVWYIIGEAYRELHDTSKAIDAFSKSVEVNPSLYCGWFYKIYYLIEDGQINEALSALEEWKKYSPPEADKGATLDQVNFLKIIGKKTDSAYQMSLPYWKDYVALHDQNISFSLKDLEESRLITIQDEKGEEAVFSELDELLKMYPDEPEIVLLYSNYLQFYGQEEKALEYIEKVLANTPDDLYALDLKAYSLSQIKRYDEALKVYDQMIALGDENASESKQALLDLMKSSPKGNDPVVAESSSSDTPASGSQSGNKQGQTTALLDKGDELFQKGDYEGALEQYERYLALSELDFVLTRKAATLNHLGRFEEALESINKAIKSGDSIVVSPYAHYVKGYTLENLGQIQNARNEYVVAAKNGGSGGSGMTNFEGINYEQVLKDFREREGIY